MLEVICGSMFSGKTEELIRRLRRCRIAGQSVVLLKPVIDKRSVCEAKSHDGNTFEAVEVTNGLDILKASANVQVVGIDEAQFLPEDAIQAIIDLSRIYEKRVIVSGLDMDYKGRPFGIMPVLLAVADEITKLHAVCEDCKQNASVSYRVSKEQEQVVIGAKDKYVALCWKCAIKRDASKLGVYSGSDVLNSGKKI
ncbi:thymidine kinase [Thermovenabulum sp.]|uniref:thymidine kinase n=1 Tax=Thermovenabulum sp. TaxID=3100335 RepID=UPI003C7D5763